MIRSFFLLGCLIVAGCAKVDDVSKYYPQVNPREAEKARSVSSAYAHIHVNGEKMEFGAQEMQRCEWHNFHALRAPTLEILFDGSLVGKFGRFELLIERFNLNTAELRFTASNEGSFQVDFNENSNASYVTSSIPGSRPSTCVSRCQREGRDVACELTCEHVYRRSDFRAFGFQAQFRCRLDDRRRAVSP